MSTMRDEIYEIVLHRLELAAPGVSDQIRRHSARAIADRVAARALDLARLELLSTPEIKDFCAGVTLEALHQRQRWGTAHDRDKSAEQWFFLVGYLGGKALRAHIDGDLDKARHHTISTAAALLQWHAAIAEDPSGRGLGGDADIAPPEKSA